MEIANVLLNNRNVFSQLHLVLNLYFVLFYVVTVYCCPSWPGLSIKIDFILNETYLVNKGYDNNSVLFYFSFFLNILNHLLNT